MRTKALAAASAIAFILFLACGLVFSQEDVKEVNDPAFTSHKRPMVPFVHDEHNEKAGIDDCAKCHHGPDDITSEGQACSDCHMTGKSTRPLIKAYHGQCRGCHVESKKGPVQCGECHRK